MCREYAITNWPISPQAVAEPSTAIPTSRRNEPKSATNLHHPRRFPENLSQQTSIDTTFFLAFSSYSATCTRMTFADAASDLRRKPSGQMRVFSELSAWLLDCHRRSMPSCCWKLQRLILPWDQASWRRSTARRYLSARMPFASRFHSTFRWPFSGAGVHQSVLPEVFISCNCTDTKNNIHGTWDEPIMRIFGRTVALTVFDGVEYFKVYCSF